MIPALLIRMCSGWFEARYCVANASTDVGSIKSSAATSTPWMPARAFTACLGSRAPTVMVAPAVLSVRVTSRPRPT